MMTKALIDDLNALFLKHGIQSSVVIVNSGVAGIGYSYDPAKFTWAIGAVEWTRALLRARAIRMEDNVVAPTEEKTEDSKN